eukprot:15459913-Alexandrium_andersonii.AAC.1
MSRGLASKPSGLTRPTRRGPVSSPEVVVGPATARLAPPTGRPVRPWALPLPPRTPRRSPTVP